MSELFKTQQFVQKLDYLADYLLIIIIYYYLDYSLFDNVIASEKQTAFAEELELWMRQVKLIFSISIVLFKLNINIRSLALYPPFSCTPHIALTTDPSALCKIDISLIFRHHTSLQNKLADHT